MTEDELSILRARAAAMHLALWNITVQRLLARLVWLDTEIRRLEHHLHLNRRRIQKLQADRKRVVEKLLNLDGGGKCSQRKGVNSGTSARRSRNPRRREDGKKCQP